MEGVELAAVDLIRFFWFAVYLVYNTYPAPAITSTRTIQKIALKGLLPANFALDEPVPGDL